jgi:hypothetical protein
VSSTDRDNNNGNRDNNRAVDAQTRERLRTASWWTFGGTVVSMLAAIGGALLGPYEIVTRRGYTRRDYATRVTAAP